MSHVTLLVSSGKFMSGSAFFLSPPENKKAKFAFCTLKRKGGSTQKQPFLTVRFRGALLTKSVTLEFSQDTVCYMIMSHCTIIRIFSHVSKKGENKKKWCWNVRDLNITIMLIATSIEAVIQSRLKVPVQPK